MPTNNTTGGGAPMGLGDSGAAPDLPDAVPEGVQGLLDGIFSFGGDMGQAFGDLVSGLASAIGGGGGQAMLAPALDTVPHLL
jgi:hypothetical protein